MEYLVVVFPVNATNGDTAVEAARRKKTPQTITVYGGMERLTRLELATSTLARWRSTR